MIAWVISGRQEPYQSRPVPQGRVVGRILAPSGVTDATSSPARVSKPRSVGDAAYERAATPQPSAQPALLARQVMSHPVVTIGPEANLGDVAQLMSEHGFHHVPVVSSSGTLLGMVSDRDVLRAGDAALLAGQIMSARVLTAAPETAIRDVARVMVTERVGSIPLVDHDGITAGIVTQNDVLRCVLNRAPLDLWIR